MPWLVATSTFSPPVVDPVSAPSPIDYLSVLADSPFVQGPPGLKPSPPSQDDENDTDNDVAP